jgi:hypothetical protein
MEPTKAAGRNRWRGRDPVSLARVLSGPPPRGVNDAVRRDLALGPSRPSDRRPSCVWSPRLRAWRQAFPAGTELVTSELAQLEITRTLMRAGINHQRVPYVTGQALRGVYLIDLTSTVLARAMTTGCPGPVPSRPSIWPPRTRSELS